MKITTNDYRDIECKFVSFNDDKLTVSITHWDDTVSQEELANISHIALD